ncbi:MAG: hypothetical protein HWN81_24025, partial [Candidatus Lokiarchaeota archaeon]|nr:hypothetical protein [Candidatus Lokiarchaeota archaeon]
MIYIIDMDFSKSFNTPINLKINDFHIKNTNLNPKNSLEVGNDSFSDEGLIQKVELFQFRNETFIRNNTDQGGFIIQNDKDGWNITDFELEFKSLNAKDAYVLLETRNDGFEVFKGVNQFFAVSFEIPNTCYLKNLTMLLQYWGSGSGIDKSEFSIRVYNATSFSNEIVPDKPIDKISDEVFFDLTDKPVNLPARWYYSNFTNLILNITKTVNNTFFAVFQSIEFPKLSGYTDDAYIAYAMETSEDKYNILFYKKSSLSGKWNSLDGKNGLLKVNFAPISYSPTPDQINLTVFKTPLNSTGKFTNYTFFPHRNNEFLIPISSSWFSNIQFNVFFKGKFRYDTYASSHFKAEINIDVLWNLSLSINEFSRNAYNKSAHFYNPKLWEYNSLYNGTELYSKFKIHSDYIEILNISNHNWVIICNQRNEIITKSFLCSNDKTNWKEIQNCVYSTDYINITANFKNSNG